MSHEFHRRSNCHQLWLIRMIWSEKQFSLSENQVPLKCDHPSFKWLTCMNDLSLNFAQHCSPYYHTLWGFGVGWGPKYWRSHHFQHVLGKNWDISFELSYGQGVERQYCPIKNFLNFFCRVSLKIAKNGEFLLFSKLLEILILNHISRVPPCEASRPDDFENVVVFGPRSFWTGVIAPQSWRTVKFWVRYQK